MAKLSQADSLELTDIVGRNLDRLQESFPTTANLARTPEGSKKYIALEETNWAKNYRYFYSIRLKGSHEMVGLIMLYSLSENNQCAEFAFFIDRNKTREGLTSEALQKFRALLCEDHGVELFQVRVIPSNLASIRFAHHNGFVITEIQKQAFRDGYGRKADLVVLSWSLKDQQPIREKENQRFVNNWDAWEALQPNSLRSNEGSLPPRT